MLLISRFMAKLGYAASNLKVRQNSNSLKLLAQDIWLAAGQIA